MSEFFSKLFSPDFMPHGYCYLWQPGIVWLHATSDSLIALSYYLIPLVLIYFVRKRTGSAIQLDLRDVWHIHFSLRNDSYDGSVDALAPGVPALRSHQGVYRGCVDSDGGDAGEVVPQALALPSPTQLRTANLKLENEITERLRIEAALQRAHDELEARVRERTVQLANANEELRKEIVERQHAQEALQAAQSELAHVTRVTSMGELMASIAHEVNQPLAAIVTNGNACQRWLAGATPNLEEGRAAVARMISEGNRASGLIKEIRAFVKKSPPQKGPSGNQRSYSRDLDAW